MFYCYEFKDLASFYVSKLGFEVWYIRPDDDLYFAIVGRDKISIMLKLVAPYIKPIPNCTRHEWVPTDAYISAIEPNTLFAVYYSMVKRFAKLFITIVII